jgi:nitroimidazol reductase NimA-like FMN-containing flavoprotein (pyridoxamine 5'-phosphate oxidase superfamily)
MVDLSSVEMDEEESKEFLERGGTGVLSFSTGAGDPPYSLPVSYGYDEMHGQFYFRLAFPADSAKEELHTNAVSFVTHRETDGGWKSVVATGELEEVSETDYDATALQGMWTVEIPLVEIFERPTKEITFRYFRLVPDQLSGRKETTTA